jgi:PAS domain S-box-containing protein
MILELLQNVALLVTLSVGLQLLAQRIERPGMLYQVLAGVLFGSVGVVAMMTPLSFAPGVIYDGRSIILSLAGFIGGPVTASVAAVICIVYRVSLGGVGVYVGTLVIIESALFGVMFYYLRRRNPRWEHPFRLWLFGMAVQSTMLLLQLLLPNNMGWQVLPQIGPTVLLLYPLGFMVAAQVFLENERRRALEAMLAAQHRVLEMIAAGAPLGETLCTLVYALETQAPGVKASILILQEDNRHLRHIAAPSLPVAYVAAVDGIQIGENAGACGAAAWRRTQVISENIATDPLWDDFRDAALAHNLRACWSTPIFDDAAHVLGTFAFYSLVPARPSALQSRLIDQSTHIAAIAISRHHQEEVLRTERDFAHQVMEAMGEGLSVTDGEGRLTYANPAFALFVGLQPEAMLGRRLAEFTVPGEPGETAGVVEEQRRIERVVYETRLRDGAGRETPVLVSGTPRMHKGQSQGAITVLTDLTERNRVEEALRESETRYRLLVDNLPFALGIYQDGKIVFANRSAAELLGANEPAELLGLSTDELIVNEGLPAAHAYLSDLSPGKAGPLPGENVFVRKNGERVPVEVIAAPFLLDGRPAVQVLAQDITERKRRQRELEAEALLAQALSETVELEPLLAHILEAGIHSVAAATKGAIQLADERGKLHIRLLHGYHNPGAYAVKFAEDFGYGARAFRLRQPLLIADVRSDAEIAYRGEITEMTMVQSAIVAPLMAGREIIGVIALENTERPGAFDADDLRTLSNIAATAALVLERARLFEEVKVQARQMSQIMQTTPQGLILISAGGRVLMANRVGVRDLAVLAAAQVGDVVTHFGDQPLAELLVNTPATPWNEVHAGSRIFEIIARPVPSDAEAEQWVVLIDDVTQARQMRKQVEMQERLATVGQLAAGIAHDFNNILSIMLLHAQMAAISPELPEADRLRMRVIIEQADNATNLIRQILDFSRQALLQRQPVDLQKVLAGQIELIERTLPESITIEVESAATEPGACTVQADPTRLRQIIMNLAINARDAMPQGGVIRFGIQPAEIAADAHPPLPGLTPGAWVRLSVADTGMGIPAEVLPHIFDPFFTTKAPGKGTGLGLAQVHGIVIQHEGQITVETAPGAGAKFIIYLPAAQVEAVVPSPVETDAAPAGQEERLLLVEDNTALRMAMTDMLESLNYKVVDVANGRIALERLATPGADFALVLSDVVMPDIGGVELVRALRREGWRQPVVLMSGHPLDEELESLHDLGVAAWLPKPCSVERLTQALAAALAHTRNGERPRKH